MRLRKRVRDFLRFFRRKSKDDVDASQLDLDSDNGSGVLVLARTKTRFPRREGLLSRLDRDTVVVRFDRFNELPLELRRLVWKFASNTQRNVDIWIKEIWWTAHGWDPSASHYFTHRYTTTRSPPAVLHVCQQSREEALKHYTLDFGTHTAHATGLYDITSKPTIYINWTVDRVCLMRPNDLRWKLFEDGPLNDRLADFVDMLRVKGLRHLAINVSGILYYGYTNPYEFCEIIPIGGDLQELTLFSEARYNGPGGEKICDRKDKIEFTDFGESPAWLPEGIDSEVRDAYAAADEHFSDETLYDKETNAWFKSLDVQFKMLVDVREKIRF